MTAYYANATTAQTTTSTVTTTSTTSANNHVSITVTTNPTSQGIISVDGFTIDTPQVYYWVIGSQHYLFAARHRPRHRLRRMPIPIRLLAFGERTRDTIQHLPLHGSALHRDRHGVLRADTHDFDHDVLDDHRLHTVTVNPKTSPQRSQTSSFSAATGLCSSQTATALLPSAIRFTPANY